MRNWNQCSIKFLLRAFNRCTLPMRNWNYFSSFGINDFRRNFLLYLTYEELKLIFDASWSSLIIVVPYLWGIETNSATYLPPPFVFLMLYLTYEELKPFLFKLIKSHIYICCTLPMRNWNPVGKQVMYIIPIILLYLTYEELKRTTFLEDSDSDVVLCCTLPMRNWNAVLLLKNLAILDLSLYLTYEELKL